MSDNNITKDTNKIIHIRKYTNVLYQNGDKTKYIFADIDQNTGKFNVYFRPFILQLHRDKTKDTDTITGQFLTSTWFNSTITREKQYNCFIIEVDIDTPYNAIKTQFENQDNVKNVYEFVLCGDNIRDSSGNCQYNDVDGRTLNCVSVCNRMTVQLPYKQSQRKYNTEQSSTITVTNPCFTMNIK